MKSLSKLKTIVLSLLVMALWGSLFPMIKIGYKAFEISSSSVPDILMFAGTRFLVCGIIVFAVSFAKSKFNKNSNEEFPKGKLFWQILLIGLFSIVLHYAFVYIGLSLTDSSKTALIKQLGSLIYICFAFLFFKNESFSVFKIIGAVIGFLGIIAINLDPSGIVFSFGDILIILASICTVIANVLSKKTLASASTFYVTGISQFVGGIVLLLVALIMGANPLSFNLTGFAVFAYICTASTIAYLLWYYVLSTSELSGMFIIKFAEPMFACIFGALLLGEDILKPQYLIAFILISTGIVLGNKKKKGNI